MTFLIFSSKCVIWHNFAKMANCLEKVQFCRFGTKLTIRHKSVKMWLFDSKSWKRYLLLECVNLTLFVNLTQRRLPDGPSYCVYFLHNADVFKMTTSLIIAVKKSKRFFLFLSVYKENVKPSSVLVQKNNDPFSVVPISTVPLYPL